MTLMSFWEWHALTCLAFVVEYGNNIDALVSPVSFLRFRLNLFVLLLNKFQAKRDLEGSIM